HRLRELLHGRDRQRRRFRAVPPWRPRDRRARGDRAAPDEVRARRAARGRAFALREPPAHGRSGMSGPKKPHREDEDIIFLETESRSDVARALAAASATTR